MYITTNWILYKCKFPKEERSIPIQEIIFVEKKKAAMVLNNALSLTTRDKHTVRQC